MNDYQEFKDPLGFTKFGRYQKMCIALLFLMAVHFYLISARSDRFAFLDENICVDPRGVPACSSECRKVVNTHKWVDENYATLFGYFCKNLENISSASTWLDLPGVISGGIFWHLFEQRFGKRVTIIVGAAISGSLDTWFAFQPTELLFWMEIFLHKFCGIAMYIQGQTLYVEMIPYRRVQTLILIKVTGVVSTGWLRNMFWLVGRHWFYIRLLKVFLCVTILIGACLIKESPRWYFSHDKIEETSRIMEAIARFNKEPTENIRKDIEKYWRDSRARPKSNDTYFGMFRYPHLRTTYFKYVLTTTLIAMTLIIAKRSAPQNLVLKNVFWLSFLDSSLIFLGVVTWYFLSNVINEKTTINIMGMLGGVGFFILTAGPGDHVAYTMARFTYLLAQFLTSAIELFLLKFIPASIRSVAIVVNLMLFFFGLQIGIHLFTFQKTKWLPMFIGFLVHIYLTFESLTLVNTKLLKPAQSIRDVEVNLREIAYNKMDTKRPEHIF